MTKTIKSLKEKGNLTLSKGQRFWQYLILIALLTFPILVTVQVIQFYAMPGTNNVHSLNDIYVEAYIWLIPALLFYIYQKKSLSFQTISVQLDATHFKAATQEVATILEWKVLEHSNEHLIATTAFSWRSQGEQITIIRNNNQLLFNSIGNPKKFFSLPTSGLNKRNKIFFEVQLKQVLAKNAVNQFEPAV